MATHSTNSTSSGQGATSMAELMAKKQPSIKSFKKGEIVPGIITKLTSGEILIDIGAKTEAVVLEKDKSILRSLLDTLKEGGSVNVSILNSESDQGNPVVSLRRFMDEKVWVKLDKLKNDGEILEVKVNDLTKGGFLVTTLEGIAGFLPNSQAILNDSPQSFVGKRIKAVVLELNRSLHKIIFSQKGAMNDADFSSATSGVKSGEVVDVLVSSTTPFGIFVSVNGSEGFIHLSELSWDRVESAENFFKVGEKVKAEVLGVDKDAKRVNLSVKRLTNDPFVEASKNFTPDKKVKGIITKISSLGAIIDLGNGVEGLIKKEKIPPTSSFSVGQEIEATVSEIDSRRHRVDLAPILKEKPIGYR